MSRCSQCQHDNAARAKFCNECGAPLPRACGSCGEPNAASAKFCGECGEDLRGAPTPSAPGLALPDAERRQLTLMFCDLVDSTGLSTRLDAEDLRETIRAYQSAAAAVIARYEGHIAQYLGDGILVYFGYPHAHEDDAARAVRSGLEIVQAVVALSDRVQRELGVRLAVRVGIHTGIAVVGAMGAAESAKTLAIGDAPNLAARIHDGAAPDTVVISETTAALVRGRFAWQALGAHSLRGIPEPVTLYRVDAVQSAPHGAETTALVGRDAELGALRAHWDDVVRGHGRVVVVRGEAGIGKSRLVRAFRASLPEQTCWLDCSCSAYATNTTLRPLVEMGPALLGLPPDEAREVAALRRGLAALGRTDDEAVALAAALLEIDAPDGAAPLSPQVRRQRTLELLLDVMARLAARQPTVLRVEDAHWSDQSTLELLGLLIERIEGHRLLLLITTRSEFRLPWTANAELSLRPLPRDHAAQLVRELAGQNGLSAATVAELLERADGNPLFLEELSRMVLETRGETHTAIPATLQDSLMARLDRISPVKLVVQVGATVGRQFHYELLQEVLGCDAETLDVELQRLVDADILYQRGTGPGARFAFRHALIQDAAYSSLTRRTRRSYHERIAEVLAARFPDTPAEVLARHQSLAGADAAAVASWQRAGQQALASFGLLEAIAHLEAGLEAVASLPAGPERVLAELGLRVTLGAPLMLSRGFASRDVEDNYRHLYALCGEAGDMADRQVFHALWGLWTFHEVRAVYPEASRMAERALRVAEEIGDAALIAAAHVARGAALLMQGAFDEALACFDEATTRYRKEEHAQLAMLFGQDIGAMALSFATWAHAHRGDVAAGRDCARRALELAAELGQPATHGFVEAVVAAFCNQIGDYDAGEHHARQLIEVAEREGMPHWHAQGQATRGWAMTGQGRLDEGVGAIRAGLEAYTATGTRAARTYFLSALIAAELARGQLDAASAALEEALAFVEESSERLCLPTLHRLRAELARARGEDLGAADAPRSTPVTPSAGRNEQAASRAPGGPNS